MDKPSFKIGTLGEIAIRCENIQVMLDFYQDVLGLEIISGTAVEGINSRGIFTVDPEGNVVELVAKLTD